MRTRRLAAEYHVQLVLVHFPLHPETPLEGRSLAELFAGRTGILQDMNGRLAGLMAAEGLPYGHRTHTYNSRLAQELGKWADKQPGGEAVHDAIYRSYFVDNVNLADVDALVEIAGSVGLDKDLARRVLIDRTYKQAVDNDWNKSAEQGVTGVPTYIAGGLKVVGAQPFEVLEELALAAGADRRTAVD